MQIQYRTTDTFSGLTAGVTYYVSVINSTQIEIFTDSGLTSQVTLTDDAIPDQCRICILDATAKTLKDVIDVMLTVYG